jgi:hypothetical protein
LIVSSSSCDAFPSSILPTPYFAHFIAALRASGPPGTMPLTPDGVDGIAAQQAEQICPDKAAQDRAR